MSDSDITGFSIAIPELLDGKIDALKCITTLLKLEIFQVLEST